MNRVFPVIALAIAALLPTSVSADMAYYPISTDEEYLMELLGSEDQEVVSRALRDLSGRATQASVPGLLDFITRTDNPELLSRAAGVLKDIGDPTAAEAVRVQLVGIDRIPLREPTPAYVAEHEHMYRRLEDETEISEALADRWMSAIEDATHALAGALLALDEAHAYATFEELIREPANEAQTAGIYRVLVRRDDDVAGRLTDLYIELRLEGDVVERGRALIRKGTDEAGREYLSLLENPETPRRDELLAVAYPQMKEGMSGLTEEVWGEYIDLLRVFVEDDPNPGLRIQAAWLLYQRASDEEREECERVLKAQIALHPDQVSEDLYGEIVLHYSKLALFVAVASLDQGIAPDRSWVIEYLGYALVREEESAYDLLTEAFRSEEAAVREAAVRCMANRPEEWALPYLLQALDDPSPGVRWDAADLLKGNIHGGHNPAAKPGAFEAIVKAVEREDNQSVFEVLTLALGASKDPRAVPILIDIYESADPADEHTREGMLYILRHMNIPEADAALAHMDPVGVGGTDWLRSIVFNPSPEDLEIIRERCLDSPDPEIRRSAFRIYIHAQRTETRETDTLALLSDRLVHDPDESVRETIASGMALKRLDVPTETLAAALKNENSWRALESLSEIIKGHAGWSGELEDAVLDNYRRLLADPLSRGTVYSSTAHNYERAVVGLLDALLLHHPETAFPLIRDYVDNDPAPDMKSGMVRLLKGYDHPDCIEYLKHLLRESPLVEVQLAAMGALDALIGAEAADLVVPLLESGAGSLPRDALRMLCDWGDTRGIEYIRENWRDYDDQLNSIFPLLMPIENPLAEEVIYEIIEDSGNRGYRLYALGERGGPRAEEYLIDVVKSDDLEEAVAAFGGLCRMKSPAALELFDDLYPSAAESGRARALVNSLINYGEPPALELVISVYRELEGQSAEDNRNLMMLIVDSMARSGSEMAKSFLREVAEGEGEPAELARRYTSRME